MERKTFSAKKFPGVKSQGQEVITSVKEYFNSAKTTMYQSVFTRRILYNLLFLLVMFTYSASNAEGSFASEVFRLVAEGHRLNDSLIYEKEVHSVMDCAHLCLSEHPQCKSINYEKGGKQHGQRTYKCQLNNQTRATGASALVPDSGFNYFEPIKLEKILENHQTPGLNCSDLYQKGTRTDGVYTIDPDGLGAFKVRCDMTKGGGGWTVIQRRMDGSVDFYLGWNNYTEGFGNLNGEFWLGLDKINRLSKSGENVLRVDLEDFENETRYAEYTTFAVANETDKYKLTVGGYAGNANDSLAFHNGMNFSTRDMDNDRYSSGNCAQKRKGAWWYNACVHSNLNGQYLHGSHSSYADGINWYHWKGVYYSLKKAEMKIRPRSF